MPDYETLRDLDAAHCPDLTAEEAAAHLATLARTEVYSRFLSLRAIGAVLGDAEYEAFAAFLQTVAGQSRRKADMAAMLEKPCSDAGDTGGLDFGNAEVRALLDAFGALEGMTDAAARVKALAERAVPLIADAAFTTITADDIEVARGVRSLVQHESGEPGV